jgi:hypothetical protein
MINIQSEDEGESQFDVSGCPLRRVDGTSQSKVLLRECQHFTGTAQRSSDCRRGDLPATDTQRRILSSMVIADCELIVLHRIQFESVEDFFNELSRFSVALKMETIKLFQLFLFAICVTENRDWGSLPSPRICRCSCASSSQECF